MIDLIYCAGGNKRMAQLAIENKWLYGAQLPCTVYFPPVFADQNWKKPRKEKYFAGLEIHRPSVCTVLDWETPEQENEVMEWATRATQFIETVIIIPKWSGAIAKLPKIINGKPVRLGFSVPTSHGGTQVDTREFGDWPVHLLGGSPRDQFKYSRHLNAVSADNNYFHRTVFMGEAYSPAHVKSDINGRITLKDLDREGIENGAYMMADITFLALYMLWAGHTALDVLDAQADRLKEKYNIFLPRTMRLF